MNCYRSNSEGVFDRSSQTVWLSVSKSEFVTPHTGYTLRYRVKLSSDSWGTQDWVTLDADDTFAGFLDDVFEKNTSYTVQIGVIKDSDSHYVEVYIPTDDIPFHLGSGGVSVGIGRYADNTEPRSIKLGWGVWLDGELYIMVNGNYLTLADYIRSIINEQGE